MPHHPSPRSIEKERQRLLRRKALEWRWQRWKEGAHLWRWRMGEEALKLARRFGWLVALSVGLLAINPASIPKVEPIPYRGPYGKVDRTLLLGRLRADTLEVKSQRDVFLLLPERLKVHDVVERIEAHTPYAEPAAHIAALEGIPFSHKPSNKGRIIIFYRNTFEKAEELPFKPGDTVKVLVVWNGDVASNSEEIFSFLHSLSQLVPLNVVVMADQPYRVDVGGRVPGVPLLNESPVRDYLHPSTIHITTGRWVIDEEDKLFLLVDPKGRK